MHLNEDLEGASQIHHYDHPSQLGVAAYLLVAHDALQIDSRVSLLGAQVFPWQDGWNG